jgi:microcystin-dependent protein
MSVSARSTVLRGVSALALGAGILAFQSGEAAACAYETYVGTVCTVAFDYCPEGYVAANGQLLPINANQALFAVLGIRYGGDGRSTFGVPDLRGRVAVGTNPAPMTGISALALGDKRGNEQVVLNSYQTPLPAHAHTATFTATQGTAQITIPAQAGSGTSLTGTGTVDVVPGIPAASPPGASSPVAGTTYSLTGGKAAAPSNLTGPYTTTVPTAGGAASVGNVKVSVDASKLVPAIPQRTIDVTMINGGAVTVNPAGAAAGMPVSLLDPGIALTYCIANQGIYPTRP